jgi:hypothetical protein
MRICCRVVQLINYCHIGLCLYILSLFAMQSACVRKTHLSLSDLMGQLHFRFEQVYSEDSLAMKIRIS